MPKLATDYSTDVTLWLKIGDRTLEVAQLTPHDCTLRQPTEIPPGPAEVIMQVNGRKRCWPVILSDGTTAVSKRVRFGG